MKSPVAVVPGDVTYTIMGNNILQNFIHENKCNYADPFAILPTTRFSDFMRTYTKYHPDIIALQECDEGWHYVLDSDAGLPSLGYAAATDGFTGEPLHMIRNVLYYDKAKFDVVAADYVMYPGTAHTTIANPWCYTWAVLKSKRNGDMFAVSSTHLISGGDKTLAARIQHSGIWINALAKVHETYHVPVILAGDCNADLPSEPYKQMLKTFDSARDVAAKKVNMQYTTAMSFGTHPEETSDGTRQIDHCLISRENIHPDLYQVLLEPGDYAYSDHVPHLLAFRVDNTPSGAARDSEWGNV